MDEKIAEILVLAKEETTAQRWAAMLDGPRNRVRLAVEDTADAARIDLIVTDRPTSGLPLDGSVEQWPPDDTQLEGPGLIRIGLDGPADVHLPLDVTERELQLACQLMVRIVRLRRKEQAHTELHKRLKRQALTDPLTGLPNRRAWDETLKERLAGVDPPERLCLAIIDLDHFKQINGTFGHAIGDEVLRAAGEAIATGLRANDFVARLGGDEFGLLLYVPDEATARTVVERVRVSIGPTPAWPELPEVTASAGLNLTPSSPVTTVCPGALFTPADTALHEAKRLGRNRTMGP